MKNYYEILGIDPSANFIQIKQAYRSKALRNHPDRGGSHAEMVNINEAWEVLSNSNLRKQYDELLKNGILEDGDPFIAAAQRAQTYEKSWEQFDGWLSALGRDFVEAKYDNVQLWPMSIPIATGSLSALIFIVTGGLVGGLVGLLIASAAQYESNGARNSVRLVVGIAILGAWCSQLIHRGIGMAIGSVRNTMENDSSKPGWTSAEQQKIRISCSSCGQILKLPVVDKQLSVTCPNCHFKFEFAPKTR